MQEWREMPAPEDGESYLFDGGPSLGTILGRWIDGDDFEEPVLTGWYFNGLAGFEIFECEPVAWMPVPTRS